MACRQRLDGYLQDVIGLQFCLLQGAHLTYRELDERANQLARFLEANGVTPEQPVGVMLERSLELMISMMAVLKAGGAFVPMDPEYPEDRLALMAEDAEVRLDAALGLDCSPILCEVTDTCERITVQPGAMDISGGVNGRRPSPSHAIGGAWPLQRGVKHALKYSSDSQIPCTL